MKLCGGERFRAVNAKIWEFARFRDVIYCSVSVLTRVHCLVIQNVKILLALLALFGLLLDGIYSFSNRLTIKKIRGTHVGLYIYHACIHISICISDVWSQS